MKVKVRPFEKGSFVLDVVLQIQQSPGYLFFASHPRSSSKPRTFGMSRVHKEGP